MKKLTDVLENKALSGVAARYLRTMGDTEPGVWPDDVSSAATELFVERLSEVEKHPELAIYVFDAAVELGFGIAVATARLTPDEAMLQIGALLTRADASLISSIKDAERVATAVPA